MDSAMIASLYDYGLWVNNRLLDKTAALTPEQFTQKFSHSFESVYHTWVHVLAAEALWFLRWQGKSPQWMLSPKDLPTLAAIRERWTQLIPERRAFLEGLSEDQLTQGVTYTNLRGQAYSAPLWQLILHGANHSTHHRSEIAAMLTDLGHEPEGTDLLEYYLEQNKQLWRPTQVKRKT